jgi:hypothetical protein
MFLLIRNWDYFPKGIFNKKPRNFRLTMMQRVKEMKKNFSNQALTKPKELYVTLDGAQPKKEHVEHNANERK